MAGIVGASGRGQALSYEAVDIQHAVQSIGDCPRPATSSRKIRMDARRSLREAAALERESGEIFLARGAE